MLDDTKKARRATGEDLEVYPDSGCEITLNDVEWIEGEADMWEAHDGALETGEPDDYTFECGWIGDLRIDRDMLALMTSYAHVEGCEAHKAGL